MTSTTASSFVGRAEELDRLLGLLDQAERGRPAVRADRRRRRRRQDPAAGRARRPGRGRGVGVLVGGCMEVGDVGLPYVPFVDAFRDLGTRRARPRWRPRWRSRPQPRPAAARAGLPTTGRCATRDSFEQVQLFDGVLSLLVRLSSWPRCCW